MLERIENRLVLAEESITELENRSIIIVQSEEKKKKKMNTNEQSLRHKWDNIKHTNIRMMEISEEEE